ncbi:MAG: radical SAM protein [Cystobacterineae bacterium]|nr:radical SAM protein [Cystobacterineae bacterium]
MSELFLSLQGESTFQGKLCAFIRLSGCNLRCRWCDTAYAFSGGQRMATEEIVQAVLKMACPLVELTGGEPLLQPGAYRLMERLLEEGLEVLLETSGSIYLDKVPSAVKKIVDIKPPGSGEVEKNCWANMRLLKAGDEVKFVLASREDYVWAKEVCKREGLLGGEVEVLFSVAHGLLSPVEVATWLIEDKLGVRFQLQQHKYIWPAEQRGV